MGPRQHNTTLTHAHLGRHKAMLHARQKAIERCSHAHREHGHITWGTHTLTLADGPMKPATLLLVNECGQHEPRGATWASYHLMTTHKATPGPDCPVCPLVHAPHEGFLGH